MRDQTVAAWVEPVALRLVQSRREVQRVAAEVPANAWDRPSGYSGWSYKDQVSHLAESHRGLHSVLRAILGGSQPDFSRFDRIDEINEENRQKHLATPVEELLAEYAKASEETHHILSGLSAEHAGFNLGPMALSQALQGFLMHDTAHLEELKKALQA